VLALAALAAVGAAAYWGWFGAAVTADPPPGIVRANGRIEAEQIDVATKVPGRLVAVAAEEGQMVEAGQVVARLDPAAAEAQVRAAEARLRAAEQAMAESRATVQRSRSELALARTELDRALELARGGFFPLEGVDRRRSQVEIAEASHAAAMAAEQRAAAARDAAEAALAEARTVLADTVLTAPRSGRVLYRLAHPGEVLGTGGRVLTLIDPTDVSMIVFLPAPQAGRLAFGAEARLVLDPFPDYVVPATVSFVSPEAQFTPRQVETAAERESLMFRVKLRLPEDLLRAHADRVKSGVRGVAYVRVASDAAWPPSLAIRLP
jgi:HlyD family secretion protein